jgi:hypothetical protein
MRGKSESMLASPRSRGGSELMSDAKKGDTPGFRRAAKQYGVSDEILDCLAFDVTRNPWRRGGWVDAIVTDPPCECCEVWSRGMGDGRAKQRQAVAGSRGRRRGRGNCELTFRRRARRRQASREATCESAARRGPAPVAQWRVLARVSPIPARAGPERMLLAAFLPPLHPPPLPPP